MNDNKEMVQSTTARVAEPKQLPNVTPAVDIFENEEEILLYADMPGVEKEHMAINIDNGKLNVSGTRTILSQGALARQEFGEVRFSRTFSVPQTIDVDRVSANLKDGVLQLHLPKSEAARPKQITINTAE